MRSARRKSVGAPLGAKAILRQATILARDESCGRDRGRSYNAMCALRNLDEAETPSG